MRKHLRSERPDERHPVKKTSKHRVGKNASKTASATQAKTPEQKPDKAGEQKPEFDPKKLFEGATWHPSQGAPAGTPVQAIRAIHHSKVPWYHYIEVQRDWLAIMNILPGDHISLDLKANPRAGNFVVIRQGEQTYICQLRKVTRSHYHCWTFRPDPECKFEIKHSSIAVINASFHKPRVPIQDEARQPFEPVISTQSKTLFVVETRSTRALGALLYQRAKGKEQTKGMKFPSARAALDWCIKNRAGFVFTLADTPADN
jgi:hypothetical protein